jgi:hypothetical protein
MLIINTILGWVMVTIILAIALFAFFMAVIIVGSLLVWDLQYSVDATVNALRVSAIIGSILAAILIALDFKGFHEAFEEMD